MSIAKSCVISVALTKPGVSIFSTNPMAAPICVSASRSGSKENSMTVVLFAIESPTIILLVVAAIFLLFGGSKLPQLAKALGQSKKAFKEGLDESERDNRNNSDARSKLNSVDDEALFEEARRRAQQMRADETKKIER